LSDDDVQRFLIHWFGPRKRNGQNGIFVAKDERGRLVVDFKGQLETERAKIATNGWLARNWFAKYADGLNADIRREFLRNVAAANRELRPCRRDLMRRLNTQRPGSAAGSSAPDHQRQGRIAGSEALGVERVANSGDHLRAWHRGEIRISVNLCERPRNGSRDQFFQDHENESRIHDFRVPSSFRI
jgi:hypothetical protein